MGVDHSRETENRVQNAVQVVDVPNDEDVTKSGRMFANNLGIYLNDIFMIKIYETYHQSS